jgi:hypothetical protein
MSKSSSVSKSKYDPPKTAMGAEGLLCLECRMGSPTYVPCAAPAKFIIQHAGEDAYPMCAPCADHNARNRGARYVRQGEEVTLAKSPAPVPEAMPVADVEEADASLSVEQIKTITTGVSRALKLQELLIPEGERALTLLKDELKGLKEQVLPNALTDARIAGWTYTDRNDGVWKVALERDIRANVRKDDMPKFVAHLEKLREDAIVKRKIVIEFGRDQVAAAKKFLRDLAARKIDLEPEVTETVAWNTLDAYVREKRQAAIDRQQDPAAAVPAFVNVHELRLVTFKREDAKKGIAFT